MSFKNPNNLITLGDDLTANIAVNGQYYPDARMRYPTMPDTVVRCDRCGKCPLACCVGLDTTNLCLECVESARTQTLPVKDLELSAGINSEFAESMNALHMNNAYIEQINDAMTEAELLGQYMLSDIQRAQLEAIYGYLAEHESQSFRLTFSESNELNKLIRCITNIHLVRQWTSDPEDRMIHPRFLRNPPQPDSAPGSGMATPPELE